MCAVKPTVSRTGTITMREIDMFENRLQLKILREGFKHKVASVDVPPVHIIYGAASLPLSTLECDLLADVLNQRIAVGRGGFLEPTGPIPTHSSVASSRAGTGPVLSITPAVEDKLGKKMFASGRQVAGGCCAFKVRVFGTAPCRLICSWIKTGKIDGLPRKDVAMRFKLLCDPLEQRSNGPQSGLKRMATSFLDQIQPIANTGVDRSLTSAAPQEFTVRVKLVLGKRPTNDITMKIPLCTTSDCLRRMILTQVFGKSEGACSSEDLRLMARGRELAPHDLVAGRDGKPPCEALSVLALARTPVMRTDEARKSNELANADGGNKAMSLFSSAEEGLGARDDLAWDVQDDMMKKKDVRQEISDIKARIRWLEANLECGDRHEGTPRGS